MNLPRLYPILDTATMARRGCGDWPAVATAMLDGGAEILQVRHKGEWTRGTFAQAEQAARECQRRGVMFMINDRADIAKMLGAGLHVGQDDLPPEECRALLGGAWIGFSTHNALQLDSGAREPVDYLAFGPVFGTESKLNPDPVVSLSGVRAARAATQFPLVAIGGITRHNSREVLEAGADSVAVIADLLPGSLGPMAVRNRMEEWQRLTRK